MRVTSLRNPQAAVAAGSPSPRSLSWVEVTLGFACFSGCSAFVHKGCRESLASCAKVKMKPRGSLQAQDTSSLPTVIMRSKPSQPKERPRSAVLLADEATAIPMFANRRSQQSVSLSKSVSIQNIAG
ncbi:A-kinase anchor protein 13-like isoform X2 [Leptonychotes weddellii]|uniref:A-kinase anchor protein 13-like isoform X2 n=1 Tax=Leptonychotes weddellii TaxID=9713 RepID=A0A7F8PZI9_LEPWE|nr:A-kinase anchor protein 13-like isoform X2 [Leptonychotes weddellii]